MNAIYNLSLVKLLLVTIGNGISRGKRVRGAMPGGLIATKPAPTS